jgi:hypothetical protein
MAIWVPRMAAGVLGPVPNAARMLVRVSIVRFRTPVPSHRAGWKWIPAAYVSGRSNSHSRTGTIGDLVWGGRG